MFYKLTEKGIEKAPKILYINGNHVFTSSEKIHNENGYYRLEELPYPQDNCAYKPVYSLQDNAIVKAWERIEPQPLPYKDRVIARIREIYSVDDELAILRQRDTKPEEFLAYNSLIEKIKGEEK